MASEYRIFSDRPFGLTVEDVAKTREGAIKGVRILEETLADNSPESAGLRVVAQKEYERAKVKEAFFSEYDDETILQLSQDIFDHGRALELAGVPAVQIAEIISDQVSYLETIYGLLRRQDWGYHLGQTALAALSFNSDPAD